jgi:16S rRNA C967 or C1407 C5-methylase (RsmB/RsmF family)/NOL1/NOP2/fmu family ribosome biogenesis protein
MKIKYRTDLFCQRMEKLIGGSEARQLLDALQPRTRKSVRYHSQQCKVEELIGDPVPWCEPFGRYWQEELPPSHTLQYAAGKYYIQEASAMLAISAAAKAIDFSDKIVLDLTAAPGGKATQTAELITRGYLVANEVIRTRVKALTWNINRHRLNNVIVTSLPTKLLAASLPGFFDVVVVDAPCSGEGLFQKRKHSLNAWSEKNVLFCARRQTSILSDAIELVRPGGVIVYSTCTFSVEENEEQVAFLLQQGFQPVPLPEDLPVSAAITGDQRIRSCSRRIFPHREPGAGAFVSVVRKESGPRKPFPGKFESFTSGELRWSAAPASLIRTGGVEGYFYESGGTTSYFSYERIPAFLRERSLQLGARVLDKRRSEALMFGVVQIAAHEAMIDVEPRQGEAYIKGEDLRLDYPDGHYFVSVQGMILGPVKITGNRAVNKFPLPLRKQF